MVNEKNETKRKQRIKEKKKMKSDDTETRRKSGKGYSEESNKIKR
jgi:hypothetical protein